MGKKVFISYSHQQGEWVWHRLKPCLEAGGAEVHIDIERFKAGHDLTAQMDVEQDACDFSVLVLSPDYLASAMCRHEMQRATVCNKFVAVLRVDCTVPDEVKKTLYVDLHNDKKTEQWDLLLEACEADLGTTTPDWLKTRDEIVNSLEKGKSVCLETKGKVKWRELINDIQGRSPLDLKKIDFQSGATCSRRGLVEEILWVSGSKIAVPREPEDLKILQRIIMERDYTTILAFLRFDMIAGRKYHSKADFFSTLKHLLESEKRKLTLLIQTRMSFSELLPPELKDSPPNLEYLKLVGLE